MCSPVAISPPNGCHHLLWRCGIHGCEGLMSCSLARHRAGHLTSAVLEAIKRESLQWENLLNSSSCTSPEQRPSVTLNFTESSLMHFTWTFKLLKSAFVQAGTPRSNWFYMKEVGLPQGMSSGLLNLLQSQPAHKEITTFTVHKNCLTPSPECACTHVTPSPPAVCSHLGAGRALPGQRAPQRKKNPKNM